MSVGYMYYLYEAYHGPSPPAQMVTLAMPCDVTDARSYPITFFTVVVFQICRAWI